MRGLLRAVAPYRKAIVAAAVAGLVALGAALADGDLSAAEVVGVLVAVLGGGGGVYAVPNSTPAPAVGGEVGPPTAPPGPGVVL